MAHVANTWGKTLAFRRLIFCGGRSELWGLPELRSPQACKRMFPYRGSRKPGDPVRRKCVLVLQRSHFSLMSMRYTILALSAASLGILGCTGDTTAPDPEVFHLSATVTASNTCAVTAMDKQYSSVNQVRGDLPDKFVGTVAGASYHGFGCWVASNSTAGEDGDLIVLFSGNHLGKPLEPGTYGLVHEVYDDTPIGKAAVTFRLSTQDAKLRTIDTSSGNVIVEVAPDGGRTVRVEADVIEWKRGLF